MIKVLRDSSVKSIAKQVLMSRFRIIWSTFYMRDNFLLFIHSFTYSFV